MAVRHALILVPLLSIAGTAAWCNDRPFQSARTAVMEDDEYTGSIETWAQRFGGVRGLSFEPEYTFAGGFSIQGELTRLKDREGHETGHEAELEFKQIFNHIGRDGYGVGISAAFSRAKLGDLDTVRAVSLRLPLSVALGTTGALLHLNVGAEKATGSRREWTTAVAAEREIYKRTWLFAEFSKTGPEKFAQIGVRHWLKKEKLALDFSLQQQRSDGSRASGFILGLGVYDL
jgi:hypothetical protein